MNVLSLKRIRCIQTKIVKANNFSPRALQPHVHKKFLPEMAPMHSLHHLPHQSGWSFVSRCLEASQCCCGLVLFSASLRMVFKQQWKMNRPMITWAQMKTNSTFSLFFYVILLNIFITFCLLLCNTAVFGSCAFSCCHHHWLLFILPRGQELKNYGLL